MKKKSLPVFFVGLLMCGCQMKEVINEYNVVPLPVTMSEQQGRFYLNSDVPIVVNASQEVKHIASGLSTTLLDIAGLKLKPTDELHENVPSIVFDSIPGMEKEAYKLSVTPQLIKITASAPNGFYYGLQTLYQLLPVDVYCKERARNAEWSVPCVEIEDAPTFRYRGAMLDVCRHFASIDYIKKFIDVLAAHKMNTFHWHLTDDQGWRIEIKKYPKLTEIGSQRSETMVDYFYTHYPFKYDGKPHGGYYTQEEIKEVVAYAQSKYITVIPEIELPGHALAAIASYPELSCTPDSTYEVCKLWGVFDQVFCPTDTFFQFMEGVMDEVVELFPSSYIHIGGDECPKVRWTKCPKCQDRIKALGIKADKNHTAEEKLQSFIINHAEKFLNDHGRQIIGWDEILEGGLAPNATVMSWRGEGGGIEAAKQKHDVIMSPNTYLYFDYYQSKDVEQEPEAIGGYLPLERVYSYEPMPASLTPEEQKYIKGVQANLWTEYIPTFSQVEYMELPRMAALADIQWTNPEHKDYQDFLQRLVRMVKIYDVYQYNYAKHVFDVTARFEPNAETGTVDVTLSTVDNCPVYYTLDGTDPTTASQLYTEPVKINTNCTFKAMAVRPTGNSRIVKEDIAFSKSTSKKITALQPVNKQYEFAGISTLVDGLKGNRNYKTGRWIAFYKNDMEAVIDFGQPADFSKVTLTTNVEKGDWIFDARSISVAVSEDGENFKQVASEEYPAMTLDNPNQLYEHVLSFEPVKARYLKVLAKPEYNIPSWHGGKGNPAFLFVDEITVD